MCYLSNNPSMFLLSNRLRMLGCFIFVTLGSYAQENAWVKMSNFLGGKRERAVAFSIGGFGYVGTGTDTAEIVHKDFWRYDPSIDAWTQIAELPGVARRDAVAFTLEQKGYVGTGMSDHISANGFLLKDFWVYDPMLNQWDSIAAFPGNQMGGVYFSTGFSVNEKGYVCGGKTGNSTYSSELWEYKPSVNSWIQRAPFPTGIRYMLSSFAIGNYAYVGFGATQDVYKKDLFQYNPGNDTWIPMPDLPGNVRGGACTFVLQDKGYVCGGYDGGLLDDLWEFDPIEQSWSIKAYFGGSERKNAVAFSIDNSFAMVGLGKGYSGKKESVYRYFPSSYLSTSNLDPSLFNLFPNPTNSTINLKGPFEELSKIQCIDANGKVVFEERDPRNPIIPILESGVYTLLLSLHDNRGNLIYKFVVTP